MGGCGQGILRKGDTLLTVLTFPRQPAVLRRTRQNCPELISTNRHPKTPIRSCSSWLTLAWPGGHNLSHDPVVAGEIGQGHRRPGYFERIGSVIMADQLYTAAEAAGILKAILLS